ncbi:MAG: 1,4-dihydroxy-6-naphthoate synthase [Rikenellaceae bacterium]
MVIKLYISPCPNDTFMFDALINGRIDTRGLAFDVEYLDIEELNSRALEGEAHISKISCALLPAIGESYKLCGCGAALGRGNGPLLVRRRGERGPLKSVAVPGVHTTANALMTKLFPQIDDRHAVLFSEVAARVESGDFDCGVLIHEGRFVYQNRDLELVADLGELWEERTGLPLPLGGIVMRNDLGEEIHATFEKVLSQSVEYAFANPQASREYIKSHAQELDDEVIDSHIRLFVNKYSLSLGEDGREALKLFGAKIDS